MEKKNYCSECDNLGIISQRHYSLCHHFFKTYGGSLQNGIRQNVISEKYARKRGVKNSISDIYHTHFSGYTITEVIFAAVSSIQHESVPGNACYSSFSAKLVKSSHCLPFETCFLSLSLRRFIFLAICGISRIFADEFRDCVFSVLSALAACKESWCS